MKIAFLSDVHYDLTRKIPVIDSDAEFVLMAGDYADNFEIAKEFFFTEFRERYSMPIILVLGNHE